MSAKNCKRRNFRRAFHRPLGIESLEFRLLLADDPDDAFSEATPFGAISTAAKAFDASISPDTDVDMYSLSVTAGQIVDFDIDTSLNGPGGLGSALRVFDGQGQQLAFNNDAAAPGENTIGFDAYLRYTFATNGLFYVAVSNATNTHYDPITGDGDVGGGGNATGSYRLTAQALPIDTNDSLIEATSLGVVSTTPRTVTGTIFPDIDVNLYSLSIFPGQIVDFDIDTALNGPGGLGSFLRLFDSQGQQLAFNNDAVAPGENLIGFDAYLRYTFTTGGTYYVGVSNANNTLYNPTTGGGDTAGGQYSIGDYQLIIQLVSATPEDSDDAINEANSLGAITTTPTTFSSTITPDTDVDMVKFTVTAGQILDFDIDTTLNGPGGLGSFLRLFDGQGQQLAFNNDAVAPGELLVGYDAYLRYTFATAGTYYLGVSNANNTLYNSTNGSGDASGGENATGDFQLIIQALPIETDDTLLTATSLGVASSTPATVNARIFPDTDVDIYAFIGTAGQIVDIDIDTPLNGVGGLGSFLRLFNGQGQQVAFNNDASAPGENLVGFDAYLRYTLTSGGIYYIGVSNANNTLYNPTTGAGDAAGGLHSIGDYQLSLQLVTATPTDPDDSLSEAFVLGAVSTTPVTISDTISPDTDVDLIRFTVTAGQVVDFDIDTTLNGAGGLGSYLRLMDSQGQQLATNNDAFAPGETTLGFDAYLRYTFVAAGTFYIGVSNANNTLYNPTTGGGDTSGGQNTTGDYQLVIQALPIDTNDSMIEATAIGNLSTTPTTISASITPDIDVDLYSFLPTAGQTIDFDIDTTLNGVGGLGSFLRLFNAQGVELSFNNDAAAPGESQVGFDAYLRYTFNAAGQYYIGVSNATNTLYNTTTGNGDAAGGLNSIGDYQLIVQLVSVAPGDPDDTLIEANALGTLSTTPKTVSDSISPDIDVDLFRFDAVADQVIDFDVDTTLNGTGGLGSFLRLFDSQGQQLAFNNDGNAPGEAQLGFDAYLRYTFATAGTYYIGVSNAVNTLYNPSNGTGDVAGGANTTGSYQLVVQVIAGDPDDAISEATSIGALTTTPVSLSGTISPDVDVDMVRFTVTAGQVVDFDIDTTLNGTGGLGSYLRLFNDQGAQIAFNNDAFAPGETRVGFDAYLRYTFLTAGTYYIGVSNSNNTQYDAGTGNGDTSGGQNATGNYDLIVQALPIDNDDAMTEATSLGALSSIPTTMSGSISTDIDVDLYRFTVTAGQIVDFDIDTTLNGPGGLDSFLWLFNSQGQQVVFNNNASASDETQVVFDAYLRHTFAAAGTYYIAVSNANNTQYDPATGNGDTAGGFNSIGDYQLIVQLVVGSTDDPDDALSEAPLLGTLSTTPTTISGSISPDIDVDMVRFVVTAGQIVDFDIDTLLNGGTGLGSYLRLFNAQGQLLDFNNNAAAPGESVVGVDAYLRYTFASAGTYYLGVSNSNNVQYSPTSGTGDTSGGSNATGDYQLIVQLITVVQGDPDDTIGEAILTGQLSTTPTTFSGAISPDTDVDMYRIVVTAGQIVDFDIDTAVNGGLGLGSYLRLFDAQGTQIAFNNDAAAPGETQIGIDSYLRYTFGTAGSYYIAVSNSNNTQYSATAGTGDTAGGSNPTGDYQLVLQLVSLTPSDPDDSLIEANSLGGLSTNATNYAGSISPDTDVDFVSFSVAAGQVVDFDIDTSTNGGSGLGSYLRLFDEQGLQLGSNNDAAAPGEGTVGTDSYLRYTFSLSGIYFLGISNATNVQYDPITGAGDVAGGPNATGDYQLILQVVSVVQDDTDDSLAEAVSIGALSTTPVTVNDGIAPDVDVDMIRFSVTAGQVIDFDIDTALNGSNGLGSYLRLFDAQGQQLAFNNDGAAPGESVTGIDAYLRHTFTAAGTYYLGISNSNNTLYNPITGAGDNAGGANATGDYQLVVQAVSVAVEDPDDSISEASALGGLSTTPTIFTGTITPDTDVDMVRFTAAAGQTIDFDIDTAINGPGGLGSFVRLFNDQGLQIGFNNDAAAPGEPSVGFDAYLRYTFTAAGTYYLSISNSNNIQFNPVTGTGDTAGGANATGGYQLSVQVIVVTLDDPDDSLSEASSLGAISTSPTTISGSLTPDTDVDVVRFSVTAGQVVDFDIDTLLNGGTGLGSYLRLFDAQGQQLAFNNDAAAPGESQTGLDPYFRYTFASAGIYYLGVSNANNILYNPVDGTDDTSGGANATGDYQLIVQAVNLTPTDPDDSLTEATSLGSISALPLTTSGTISPDIDVDLYRFTVTAGQVVDFDIDTILNGGSGLGTFLRVFNSQGQQLAFNDNGAAPGESSLGLDAYIRYTFATDGTYYVGVSNGTNIQYNPLNGDGDVSGGSNATGDYNLTLSLFVASAGDPDDTLSEATQLGGLSATPTSWNASISPDIDVDMYRFSVTAGQSVDFDIDTIQNGAGGLGSFLRLFDSQGQQLAFGSAAVAPGESQLGLDAYLRHTFSSTGTYYIGISNTTNTLYDPLLGASDVAGGANSTGDYQLNVQIVSVSEGDPDDSLAEAFSLGAITTTSTTTSGSISPDIDVDLIRFTVSAGQVVEFDLDTATNGGSGLDAFLRLIDSQGQQLIFNNQGAAPGETTVVFDPFLRYSFATTGTYYIGVSNANNPLYNPINGEGDAAGGPNATGSYQLSIRALPTFLQLSATPSSIPEFGGVAIGTVSRVNADTSQALTVLLSSSDTGAATVPVSVVIPANQSSVNFLITAVDDLQVDGTTTVIITATSSQIASSTLSIAITDSNGSWHNALRPYDVNQDNLESPLDALLIFNYLNIHGTGTIPEGSPPPFLDVNSDNFISPVDALQVINFLNLRGVSQGEGEGKQEDSFAGEGEIGSLQSLDAFYSELGRKRKG